MAGVPEHERARELPVPSLDMTDGEAATWLLELAEEYEGTDRWHVRTLALRLRRQWDEAIEEIRAVVEAKKAEVVRLEEALDANEAEVSSLAEDRRDLESELAAARRRAEEEP